jgi:hypothetical protein
MATAFCGLHHVRLQMPHRITFEKVHAAHRECLYSQQDPEQFPIVCGLHDVLRPEFSTGHNCLGCNLADLTNAFDSVLKVLTSCEDLQAAFSTYFMWLNVFVERYTFLLKRLNVSVEYRRKEFPCFATIKSWANFQKHPKSFLYVHHPEYGCSAAGIVIKSSGSIVVNQSFVDRYYNGDKHDDELLELLKNTMLVAVDYPDPTELIVEFCAATTKFMDLVKGNPEYQRSLADVTTHSEYFADEEEES